MFRNYAIDGANFAANPLFNAAGTPEIRVAAPNFAPGTTNAPIGGVNPRTISNVVVQGDGDLPGPPFSGFAYAVGQFLDHDLDRTGSDKINHIDITIPAGDPSLVPGSIISLTRAIIDPATGNQVNAITGWLDASQVYGSDAKTAASLRTADGHMKVSAENNLPVGPDGQVQAGDVRAAENSDLTAIQVLLIREHNFWADRLSAANPQWTGDQVFNAARAITTAEWQNVVYSEYLPLILGSKTPGAFQGFNPGVDPRISHEFAGAAFRFGHSIVSGSIAALDNNGVVTSEQTLDETFGDKALDFDVIGTDGILRSLSSEFANKFDSHLTESLRTLLADPAGQDLAAVNIQRGRDLGLPTLNQDRIALGLKPYASISEITKDAATVDHLSTIYGGDVNKVELWIGGLSEDPAPGALVGSTFQAEIARQFAAIRDGDPLFFENQGFSPEMMAQIKATTFSDIILRNTDTKALQDNAFLGTARHASDVAADDPTVAQLVIGIDDDGAAIVGGTADDTLVAGLGDGQTLSGGGGADTFQFLDGAPHNATVLDFTPGVDRLDFEATVARGLDFQDLFITAGSAGAIISVGDDVITLAGVTPAQLSAIDFVFDQHAAGPIVTV